MLVTCVSKKFAIFLSKISVIGKCLAGFPPDFIAFVLYFTGVNPESSRVRLVAQYKYLCLDLVLFASLGKYWLSGNRRFLKDYHAGLACQHVGNLCIG